MDLASVLQAIKRADAAGDTDAARKLGSIAQQMMAPPEAAIPVDYTMGELLGRGVRRGAKQLGSTFGDIIPAMGASALGFDEYAKQQMEEAKQTQKEIAQTMAPQYKSLSDVKGIGDYIPFALETAAEQVPNIATSLIPGVGAGALAARAGVGAAGKAAAVNAGTFLGAYAQNAPEVFQNIYQETGQLAPGASAIFGAGAAALDSILPASLAKQLSGPVKMGIVEKVLEKSGMDKGLLRSVTASAIKGVPAEGLTEGAQEAISIAAEKFVGDNPQIFESKEWNRIMESSVRGAIAGGMFGGAGGGIEAAQNAAQRRAEYADALERRGQRQLAAEVRRESAALDELAAQQPQMQLPGFELGAATELYNPPKAEKPGKEPKELKGKQAELFTPEGELTPAAEKIAAKDEKAAANIARLKAQRDAAETKEAQAKLKKFLASKQMELPGFDKASIDALQEQVAAQQAAAQESGQGDLFAQPTAQALAQAPASAQPITTPVVQPQVQTAPTLENIAKIDDPKKFGKLFGIGPTARILKVDGPLAGKDLSNPADAAEVKQVLEAYASGKPATGAAEKIEAFLKRPEFQGVSDDTRTVEQPSGAGAGVPSKPSVGAPAGAAEQTELGGVVPAGKVVSDVVGREGQQPSALEKYEGLTGATRADAIRGEIGLNEKLLKAASKRKDTQTAEQAQQKIEELNALLPEAEARDQADARDSIQRQMLGSARQDLDAAMEQGAISQQEATELVTAAQQTGDAGAASELIQDAVDKATEAPKQIGKRAKKDLVKAEQGAAKATEEQAQFISEVDQNVNDLLTSRLREEGRNAGLKDEELPSQDYRGSEVHNFLRLPMLFSQYRDSQNLLKESIGTPQEAKNRQQMAQIEQAIGAAGPEAMQIFNQLRNMPIAQQDRSLSELNRIGLREFDTQVKDLVAKTKAEIEAQRAPTAASEELTDAELDALADDFNAKFMQQTGKRIFLPAYEGPTFNQADADLAQAGDFNGLLRSMLDQIKDPAIKQVLRKLRSLNLTPKLVVAPVEDGKAGSYDPATNTITLDPNNGLNAHTFIHETIHAAISNVLASPNHPLTKQFQKFFDLMQNRLGAAYGAQDLQEFAAELVGNPSFQAVLKSMKTPRSESMFMHILRSIAEFLGFMPKSSAFDTGLKFIDKALDLTGGVEATAAQKMFLSMGDFSAIAQIGNAMPAMTRQVTEDAKNIYSNLSDGGGFKQMAFGLLRLDNLRNMYGDKLPSIQTLLDALEKRTGMQERKIKDANTKYKEMVKVQKANPQAMKRLNDIAIDARIAGVDLLSPKFQPEPAQQAEYTRLKQQFNSLPEPVRKVYETIRKDYDASFYQYMDILKRAASSVSPSLATRLAQEFQIRKPLVGYVPFLRQGDFSVEYTDPQTNERAVSSFQSFRERQQFVDSMLKGKPHRLIQNVKDMRFAGDSLPPSHFIYQVIAGLKQQGASDAQVDGVYQAYLATFPAESLMKQFMKSKNVAGMERDIIRGYSDLMVRYARKLSNSEYIPQIDRALRQVQNEAQSSGDSTLVAAAQNITDQSAFFHNPTYSTFVHTATALSYFEYIAGNISSALINVTSLPMMVWPMLVGRHGWANASAAMTAAGKTAMNDWSKGKYKNLYETLMDHAQLEHTMAREVLEGRRQSTDDFVGLKARILDGLSIPMSAAEKYNRAVTAIAAYDLAKQSGMSEEKAVQQALNTVKDVHTSGLAATGPKWMQTPLGRMFFTFKSFIWNSAYVMARAFHQAFKGENPQIRAAAQRQLLATYGMATVMAGMKGMPFYGAVSVLANMINALFGDDEEPFDFDEFMRDTFGETLFKGFANKVLNLEIANRAGIATDLIFRDDPRGIADHGYVLSALQQAFGPLGTIGVNSERAAKLFADGEVVRALETIGPSFYRNASKGVRYLVEGATTVKGDPIMEDIGAYNSLMQMVGFSPADLSSTYERTQAAKGFEREVLQRRQNLLNKYDMAMTAGDTDLLSKTMDQIAEFNSSRPAKAITGDTLRRSQRARAAAEKEMVAGVRFDKDLRQEILDKFYDDED